MTITDTYIKRATLPSAVFGVLLATSGLVSAETRIAILSDHYMQGSAERIASEFGRIFEDLRAGDQFIGMSPDGVELWNASLPNEELYNSHARHRQNKLAPVWQQVMVYFQGAITTGTHDTQVNYPIILHDALRYRAGGGVQVAFYGNPLWEGEDAYKAFALIDSYPTDAHFEMDRGTSPFGRSRDKPLDGVSIHFCVVEGGTYLSGAHEEGIQRTYSFMAQAAGARLATFSGDVSECSRRFSSADDLNAPDYVRDPSENRFAMISGDTNIRRTTSIAPANANPALAAAIQAGVVEMVRLHLFDNSSEDGDVVTLSAPGFTHTVSLTNAGETFEVPLVHGAMILNGDHDGGGGITVSVALPDGTHIIDGSMSEGEQVTLTIP